MLLSTSREEETNMRLKKILPVIAVISSCYGTALAQNNTEVVLCEDLRIDTLGSWQLTAELQQSGIAESSATRDFFIEGINSAPEESFGQLTITPSYVTDHTYSYWLHIPNLISQYSTITKKSTYKDMTILFEATNLGGISEKIEIRQYLDDNAATNPLDINVTAEGFIKFMSKHKSIVAVMTLDGTEMVRMHIETEKHAKAAEQTRDMAKALMAPMQQNQCKHPELK